MCYYVYKMVRAQKEKEGGKMAYCRQCGKETDDLEGGMCTRCESIRHDNDNEGGDISDDSQED